MSSYGRTCTWDLSNLSVKICGFMTVKPTVLSTKVGYYTTLHHGAFFEVESIGSHSKIFFLEIDFIPALYKIYDEIIVNAADNKVRDPNQTLIKVDISKVSYLCFPFFFVKNDN